MRYKPAFAFCFAFMLSLGPSQSQDVSNRAWLESLSEKELFKVAESKYSSGEYEVSYQALKTAFTKRNNKEHKKYTPMFLELRTKLSNGAAAQGQQELAKDALDAAEKQLQTAKSYLIPSDATKTVDSLQESIEKRKSELKKQFADGQTLAGNHEFEEALKILNSLLKFEKHVGGIKAEIEKTEFAFQNHLVQSGQNACAARDWQQATGFFQKALLRNANDQQAKAGLERVDRGAKADLLASTAKQQAAAQNFADAMRSIDAAIQTDKETKDFPQIKDQIASEWTKSLEDLLSRQLANDSSFAGSRDAVLSLETLQQLNPDHPLVAANLVNASKVLSGNSLGYVDQLSSRYQDGSRAATMYAILMSVKSRDTSDTEVVSKQQLMGIADLFNRKRSSQLVINIPNAASAPAQFENSITERAIESIKSLELPDLRVRKKDEYDANPQHDQMFWDRPADGKCAVAFLTILIDKYFSERTAQETFKDSKFMLRTEQQVNPKYEAKRKENDQKLRDVQSGLIKVKDKDRSLFLQQLQSELDSIPKTIEVQVLRDYRYREVQHTQTTELKLVATLRDAISTASLAQADIRFPSTTKGLEITGVNEKDTEGHQNQTLVMVTKEEALGQAQRFALDELGKKLPEMLALFTNRFLLEGKRKLAEKQLEDAVENLLCHWAFVRGRLSPEDSLLTQDSTMTLTGYNLIKNNQEFLKLVNTPAVSR